MFMSEKMKKSLLKSIHQNHFFFFNKIVDIFIGVKIRQKGKSNIYAFQCKTIENFFKINFIIFEKT